MFPFWQEWDFSFFSKKKSEQNVPFKMLNQINTLWLVLS